MTKHAIPSYLGKPGKTWLRKMIAEFDFPAESDWEMAIQAAGCLDRLEQSRAAIVAHGILVAAASGGWKPNPACGIERDAKILFSRLCRELRLGDVGEEADRIPRLPKARR